MGELYYDQNIEESPFTDSLWNPLDDSLCNAVHSHCINVSGFCHVDLPDELAIAHDPAELLDHGIGGPFDLPKEVLDLELLQLAEQIVDP